MRVVAGLPHRASLNMKWAVQQLLYSLLSKCIVCFILPPHNPHPPPLPQRSKRTRLAGCCFTGWRSPVLVHGQSAFACRLLPFQPLSKATTPFNRGRLRLHRLAASAILRGHSHLSFNYFWLERPCSHFIFKLNLRLRKMLFRINYSCIHS